MMKKIFLLSGLAFQSDYNESGLNISIVWGVNLLAPTFNANVSYQWRIRNQWFISLGLMGGIFESEEYVYDYNQYRLRNVDYPYLLPTLSFNYNF